ncbi:MAG: FtsX-like permease family protein [Vicinamibacteria bacterium]
MGPRTILKRLVSDQRFTALAVLTLTVGIGITVAIFSLVYGVLLAPLPYPDPERLVDISHTAPGLDLEDMDISVPLYLRYRERVRSFEEMVLVRDDRVSLTGLETPDRVRQGTVTASLFRLARVAPLQGRAFTEEDEQKRAPAVEPRGMVFAPIRGPEGVNVLGNNVSLVVRTDSSPDALADAARAAVWAIDPNVPITHALTLEQLVSEARAPMAFSMSLLLLASVLAVLLAAVGTYGVVSFVVSQRTQEIGVRIALGALRSQVRSMIVRDGLRTVVPGLALGLLGAFLVTRTMASLLYAVSPLDPWSFILASVMLLAVAIAASLLPAERAARVNPLTALRQE